MKLNVKTVAGTLGGVAIGYFLLNSKNPLILIALGVGGGFIAHTFIKTKADIIAESNKKSADNLKAIEKDIEASLQQKSSVEGMKFNKEVGYMTPTGTVEETAPKNYMDLNM